NAKSKNKLAGRASTREARIGNLAKLIAIAYEPIEDMYAAYATIREFLAGAAPDPFVSAIRPDAEELQWIRTTAKNRIEESLAHKDLTFSMAKLAELDLQFGFTVQHFERPIRVSGSTVLREARFTLSTSNLKALFLWTLAHLLGGAEGWRIVRCAEPNCE